MQPDQRFQQGDVVIHPRRPEWGQGVVNQAASVTHDGQKAQRLVVDFANKGRVTINTAVAPLAAKENRAAMSRTMTSRTSRTSRTSGTPGFTNNAGAGNNASRSGNGSGGGWLAQLERGGAASDNELWRLPDSVSDPFISDADRLKAILDLYRFSTEPRSLIDWAVNQTDLADPLSRYTRHELELGFEGFARSRETQLRETIKTLKKQGQHPVIDHARQTTKQRAAKNALEKVLRG